MPGSDVTVIVVSYNTVDKLRRCLAAIEPEHEVVVVDNGSSDGSAEMVRREFPHVHLIANASNAGFGAANNQGLEVASRPLALLLNSDCYADPGAIGRLAKVFGDPRVVAAGGVLRNPDGTFQRSAARMLTLRTVLWEQTPLAAYYRFAEVEWYWYERPPVETRVVPQVMGACLMMRPVERFDQRYFLYCEDTDLCVRLARHGEILWVPDAEFEHELGGSSRREPWLGIARYNAGKELFFRIHHGPVSALLCLLLDRLGAVQRLLLSLFGMVATLGVAGRFRRGVGTWWRVLTARNVNPPRGSGG